MVDSWRGLLQAESQCVSHPWLSLLWLVCGPLASLRFPNYWGERTDTGADQIDIGGISWEAPVTDRAGDRGTCCGNCLPKKLG